VTLVGSAPSRFENVVQREIAGEVFLVPIKGHLADLQELFVLNDVGGWLWERLDGRTEVDELASAVSTEFDVDAEQARRGVLSLRQDL
jgi:hypothetical protein